MKWYEILIEVYNDYGKLTFLLQLLEIQSHAPGKPRILVGLKNDLRSKGHVYKRLEKTMERPINLEGVSQTEKSGSQIGVNLE